MIPYLKAIKERIGVFGYIKNKTFSWQRKVYFA